ncbi:DegT/DnrJ/EryC1/StrS family aminotransferase, partial [Planctomycetota bacterium]|nr:DegT/DnrJ/EryC1/StrS family aminotransferase [Planctomycetota bacterium]
CGPRTEAFERAFAERVGAKHAVGLSSCTAALHLALVALDLGPGDEVITTPITWAATANVIVHTGATPVFADVDPLTLCLDPASVAERITEKTKAVVPVHYAGQPADLDSLHALCDPKGIAIVEDSAHAIETRYKGQPLGARSQASCYSFYATKNLTTGEGGMLTTNDAAFAEKVKVLSRHGVSKDAWNRYSESGFKHYQVVYAGFKANMFDLQAALGLKQLERLDAMHEQRRTHVARFRDLLGPIEGVSMVPQHEAQGCTNAFHLLPITVDDAGRRDWVMAALQKENVGVGIHFPALHLQPFYLERLGGGAGTCPVAEDFAARTLSLPLFPTMSPDDQDDVARALSKLLGS